MRKQNKYFSLPQSLNHLVHFGCFFCRWLQTTMAVRPCRALQRCSGHVWNLPRWVQVTMAIGHRVGLARRPTVFVGQSGHGLASGFGKRRRLADVRQRDKREVDGSTDCIMASSLVWTGEDRTSLWFVKKLCNALWHSGVACHWRRTREFCCFSIQDNLLAMCWNVWKLVWTILLHSELFC